LCRPVPHRSTRRRPAQARAWPTRYPLMWALGRRHPRTTTHEKRGAIGPLGRPPLQYTCHRKGIPTAIAALQGPTSPCTSTSSGAYPSTPHPTIHPGTEPPTIPPHPSHPFGHKPPHHPAHFLPNKLRPERAFFGIDIWLLAADDRESRRDSRCCGSDEEALADATPAPAPPPPRSAPRSGSGST